VRLVDPSGQRVAATTADELGDFSLTAPEPGLYTVTLHASGLPAEHRQARVPLDPGQAVHFVVRR